MNGLDTEKEKRMKSTKTALAALAVSAAALIPPVASAQGITSGRIVNLSQRGIDFPEPVKACLKFCSRVVVERQTFHCRPYFAPPDRCDLPWVDASYPNPDWFGEGAGCVPEKAELAGYDLDERVERVELVTTQGADCQASTAETVVQVLPDRGNPPRECPDPGAWVSQDERIVSIQFMPCR
jgi:hypothetical protein